MESIPTTGIPIHIRLVRDNEVRHIEVTSAFASDWMNLRHQGSGYALSIFDFLWSNEKQGKDCADSITIKRDLLPKALPHPLEEIRFVYGGKNHISKATDKAKTVEMATLLDYLSAVLHLGS